MTLPPSLKAAAEKESNEQTTTAERHEWFMYGVQWLFTHLTSQAGETKAREWLDYTRIYVDQNDERWVNEQDAFRKLDRLAASLAAAEKERDDERTHRQGLEGDLKIVVRERDRLAAELKAERERADKNFEVDIRAAQELDAARADIAWLCEHLDKVGFDGSDDAYSRFQALRERK